MVANVWLIAAMSTENKSDRHAKQSFDVIGGFSCAEQPLAMSFSRIESLNRISRAARLHRRTNVVNAAG